MKLRLLFAFVLVTGLLTAKEYHVSKSGSDQNPGTKESPFLTIQKAADVACAGDVITIYEGVYRERITPPRGGESDQKRIVYRAAQGEKVEINVVDNGNGIPKKVLEKVFQPFFTTKPTGQGTGLGLSLSYDIIKAHGGDIKVNTKENEGTAFIISLPTN